MPDEYEIRTYFMQTHVNRHVNLPQGGADEEVLAPENLHNEALCSNDSFPKVLHMFLDRV